MEDEEQVVNDSLSILPMEVWEEILLYTLPTDVIHFLTVNLHHSFTSPLFSMLFRRVLMLVFIAQIGYGR